MPNSIKKTVFAALSVGFLWSCNPQPSDSDLLRNMVVLTDYDKTATFTSYNSYTLVLDTISYFSNQDPNPADTSAVGGGVSDITTEVNTKLTGAGYTRVAAKASPDLRVYIFVLDNINYSQTLSYYPYGYGYGYGFGYGYGYGGYAPTVTETEYTDLYIEIFDLKHLNSSNKPKLIWSCDIGDLFNSNDPTTATTLRAIDQAFKQSPYIQK